MWLLKDYFMVDWAHGLTDYYVVDWAHTLTRAVMAERVLCDLGIEERSSNEIIKVNQASIYA